jgi:hypothetical protein
MDIFESLENLNVSEECFDEIMGIIEAIISESTWDQIEKVHGTYGPSNYKLYQGAHNNRQNELKSRLERKFSEITKGRGINLNPKSKEEIGAYNKAVNDAKEQSGVDQVGKSYISSRSTKNRKGEYKTYQRQEHNRAQNANA